MHIRTENIFAKMWTAVDDDTYDGPGSPIGSGTTEAEAIADLKLRMARDPVAPFVCFSLWRGEEEVSVVVEFRAHTRERHEITDVWIDGDGEPLGDAERVTLEQWFDGPGHDTACDAAEGHQADPAMDRGCAAYHRNNGG